MKNMRKPQLNLKKRITFDEWKARKDREINRDKETKTVNFGILVDQLTDKRLIAAANVLMKKTNENSHNFSIRELAGPNNLSHAGKEEIMKSDDYIVKESGKLTFREWLHNKNIMERDKIRKHLQEQREKERIKKERQGMVDKAYNVWLIRSKYRNLQKYYPQLGEEKIREILLRDVSKLSLSTTKDIGVGDSSIDHVLAAQR